MKPLLIDTNLFQQVAILQENVAGPSTMKVRGLFQVEDVPNDNKRIYPRSMWDATLSEGSKFVNRMKSDATLGMVEHPADGNTRLDKVSHKVTSLVREKDPNSGVINIVGEAVIFSTDEGLNLQRIFKEGGRVGVSSRGRGDTKKDDKGFEVVQDDFDLDTFDFVAVNSVPGANPVPVHESLSDSDKKAVKEKNSMITKSNELIGRAKSELQDIGKSIESVTEVTGATALGDKLRRILGELDSITEETLQGQVGELRGILGHLQDNLSTKIGELAKKFTDSKHDSSSESKDLEAAKKLIEALRERYIEYRRDAEAGRIEFKEDSAPCKLITVLVEKCKGLLRSVQEQKSKAEASMKLLECILNKHNGVNIRSYVDSIISTNPSLKVVKDRLLGCRSVKEVKERVEKEFRPLLESVGQNITLVAPAKPAVFKEDSKGQGDQPKAGAPKILAGMNSLNSK